MATFYAFKDFVPVVDPTAYVHENATVIGNVHIGKQVYIGPGAVLRGDWGKIIIKDGCNVQENCILHMFPGTTITLNENAHIGHGAIIHGATIGKNSLIGMNAVLMDEVIIGDECIIGALSFIKARTHVPKRSLVVGNPGKIIKKVSDEMMAWKTEGTEWYQKLPDDFRTSLKACEPLDKDSQNPKLQAGGYKPWK